MERDYYDALDRYDLALWDHYDRQQPYNWEFDLEWHPDYSALDAMRFFPFRN